MQPDIVDVQAAEIDTLRERIRQLEAMLVPAKVDIPLEWGLTASEARVFAFLTTRDVATKENILNALYSDRPGDEPEMKIVDVFICKIRRKVRPHGVQITTVWGRGYTLENRSAYLAEPTASQEQASAGNAGLAA